MYTSHICHSLSVFTDYQIYHGDRPRSEEKERLICIYRSRRNRWHSGFVKTFDYKTLNEEQEEEEEGIKCRESENKPSYQTHVTREMATS